MESEYDEEIMTKEDYLKNLDLQDFLNNSETKEILEKKHIIILKEYFKQSLMALFENMQNRVVV